MSLYADDLLLYGTIQSPSDYRTLQAEIDALSDWISGQKLQLNYGKCKCMLVTQEELHHASCVINQWPTPIKSVFLQVSWNSINI